MRTLAFWMMLAVPAVVSAQESTAAASPDAMAAGSPLAGILPMVLIFVVFYFLLIKPQQKRMKEHQALLGALTKGDEVVTAGGVVGKIVKVNADDTFTVEIAKGVEVAVIKSTVASLHGASAAAAKKKVAEPKNEASASGKAAVANDN